jgi:hypothetical protein
VEVIFIGILMMLPMICGGFTFVVSQQAVEGKFNGGQEKETIKNLFDT